MTAARILTVRQPWAWAIIHGGKNVENRVRNIAGDYRGPVLIHAAQNTGTWNECEAALQAIHVITGREARAEFLRSPRGAIIGVVDLVAVHSVDEVGCMAAIPDCSPWAEKTPGLHHIVLANPRALDEPIPYRGALGLRRTDFEIVGDYIAAPWGHPANQVCTPMGCEPGCYLEPVGRLVATS